MVNLVKPVPTTYLFDFGFLLCSQCPCQVLGSLGEEVPLALHGVCHGCYAGYHNRKHLQM